MATVLLTCLSRPENDSGVRTEADVGITNDEVLPGVGFSMSPAISSPR